VQIASKVTLPPPAIPCLDVSLISLSMKHRVLSTICLLAIFPSLALAWGGDGHQLVCLIAEDRLTPAAKAGIHDLLGKDVNISDAELASWADNVRRERRETGPWHYVNVPVNVSTTQPATQATFNEARDGDDGNNVVDKITDFEKVLKDPNAKKTEKAEALKFLVHFVGDLHQPLHCAERNKDKGGNSRLVFFLARQRATNLHSVWDSAILLNRKGTTRNVDYSDKLNKAITPEQAAVWEKGTPVDWANESHDLAVTVAYKGVPVDGPPPKLDQKYLDAAGLVIDQQLQRGGVRLARILNEAFEK
jgi:hypothetical protein